MSEAAGGLASSDIYAGALPVRLDSATIRELSRINPALSLFHIVLEWTLVVLAAVLCWHFWFNPVLYLVTVAFIGARQHALIILMHDGAHRRLFRRSWLNDWITELFLAWPLVLISMHSYRRNHFPHHRYLNSERDPDWMRKQTPEWSFPKKRSDMARLLLVQGFGLGIARFVLIVVRMPKGRSVGRSDERVFRRVHWPYVAVLAVGAYALGIGVPVLLLWVLPFLTWTQLAFHIRSMAEHFGIGERPGIWGQTRTVIPTFVDRVFLVPKNVGYHTEHHLYPSVPFHRLPRLHAALMLEPTYRSSAAVTHGYRKMLGELIRTS